MKTARTMKSASRLIALILSVAMVFAMMPTMGLAGAAHADDESYLKAYHAYQDFKAAYDAGEMDWDTLIKASYYYRESKAAGDDVDPLTMYYEQHVTELDLNGKKITDCTFYDGRDVGSLALFKGLKVLRLINTDVTQLGALAELTDLEELYLSGNKELAETGALANLTNLRILAMADTGFTNDDFGPIVNMTSLEYIDLCLNKQLTAIGPLAQLPALTVLHVDGTGLTQLREVGNFPNVLEGLSARDLNLTSDQALSGLVQMAGREGAADLVDQWDLTGSVVADDPEGHVAELETLLGNKFLAPETGEDKVLEKAKKDAIKELRRYAEERRDQANDPRDIDILELRAESDIKEAASVEEVELRLLSAKEGIDTIIDEDQESNLNDAKEEARELVGSYDPADYSGEYRTILFYATTKVKLKAIKRGITVKLQKVSKGSGYEVRYSDEKSMSFVEKTTLKGNGKVVVTAKGLVSGEKYYVAAMPYKNYKGHKYLGILSQKKAVKTK